MCYVCATCILIRALAALTCKELDQDEAVPKGQVCKHARQVPCLHHARHWVAAAAAAPAAAAVRTALMQLYSEGASWTARSSHKGAGVGILPRPPAQPNPFWDTARLMVTTPCTPPASLQKSYGGCGARKAPSPHMLPDTGTLKERATHHVLHDVHVEVGRLEQLAEQRACLPAGRAHHCLAQLLLRNLVRHVATHEHAAVDAQIPAGRRAACPREGDNGGAHPPEGAPSCAASSPGDWHAGSIGLWR